MSPNVRAMRCDARRDAIDARGRDGTGRDGTGRRGDGSTRRDESARATDRERSQERILKSIHELYERGPSGAGGAGTRGTTIGLLDIANDPLLRVKCFKPRKK